jgi:ribosome-associated heat shock protein Hsp15
VTTQIDLLIPRLVADMDDETLSGDDVPSSGVQRLDKWLWYARVAKSRTLSAQLVLDGRVRVNRVKAVKASQTVRPGDVLTVVVPGGAVRIMEVLAPGVRRGPSTEARLLYKVVSPMNSGAPSGQNASAGRERGARRPTKRERRLTDRLTDG